MSQLGELLERFRHTATPGPPAAAGGVPGDLAADLQSELRPLLAALDAVEDEARTLVDAAAAEAATVRELAAGDVARILDEARSEAARARAAPLSRETDDEAPRILASARAEAADVHRRARARIPGLVARVVACMSDGGEVRQVEEVSDVAGVGRR